MMDFFKHFLDSKFGRWLTTAIVALSFTIIIVCVALKREVKIGPVEIKPFEKAADTVKAKK